MFSYNTIGFLFVHPLLINYYKSVGLREASNPSKGKLAELIILRKEDILSDKINFERIHKREFRLNGSMYDVVREIHNGSFIYFYCINDSKEEALIKEFRKRIEDNTSTLPDNQAGKKQRANDNNPLKKLISEPVCYSIFEQKDTRHLTYKHHNDGKYLPVWKEVFTPPPQPFFS